MARWREANFLHVLSAATERGCKTFVFVMTEQHFTEVVGSEEFLNLGMEQVSSLIASDKLTIPTEEKVYICLDGHPR